MHYSFQGLGSFLNISVTVPDIPSIDSNDKLPTTGDMWLIITTDDGSCSHMCIEQLFTLLVQQ